MEPSVVQCLYKRHLHEVHLSRSCSHLRRFQRRDSDTSGASYHRIRPEIGNGRHADMDPALYNRLQAWSRNSICLLAAVNTSSLHLSGDLCLSSPSIETIAYSRANFFTIVAVLSTSFSVRLRQTAWSGSTLDCVIDLENLH